MRITGINNGIQHNHTTFGRRPTKEEEPDLQKAMDDGFKAIGTDQRIAITHGSVFPAAGRDSFVGSPYGEGATRWINFLKLYGFNGNQLGPNGMILYDDKNYSPYNSSALNENFLFIDLKPLTTEKYGKILSEESYEKLTIPADADDKNYRLSNFAEAKYVYFQALNESYKNFKANLAKGQPEAIQLNKEFEEFKAQKGKQTEEEGLYRVLSTLYGDEDCDNWPEYDSDLMILTRQDNIKAKKHYASLIKRFHKSIEEYQFEQFIVTKQIKENKAYRDSIGFTYFSDLLVGCSKMDYWRYKEAFLKGYYMGAPEYDPNKPHQTWGVPVINPQKLFTQDGKLNIGGEFLREKLRHALENCENLRIDHAMGLIEPFIYREDSIKYDENGKQIKDALYCRYLSQLFEAGTPIDKFSDYEKILYKIVFPALQEKNITDKNAPVWENLCSEPTLFKKVYYEQNNLPHMIMLDYKRGKDENNPNDWYLLGSHDSIPVLNMLKRNGGAIRQEEAWEPRYLAGYLNQDPQREKENIKFCDKISNTLPDGTPKTGDELAKADMAIVQAKFAELLLKKKIQISFADLLGITDNGIVYNIGGDKNPVFWRERLAPDFEDKYYENLSSETPTALNMPEVLKTALQASIDRQLVDYMNQLNNDMHKDEKIIQKREELYAQYGQLLDKLQHYADVLKEKE